MRSDVHSKPARFEFVRRHRDALLAVAVLCVACLPFLGATKSGFVAWDDDVGIEDNLNWRGLGFEQLRWMFTTFTLGHWQPLAWMSFGLEHEIWGVNPGRMHALNIALHGLNAALFFLVAARVSGVPGRALAALLAAIFFAWHPLRVEAVAWITERAQLLATSLALASVLAWLKSIDDIPSRRWRLASIALFALSLMTKTWGVTLPFVLVVLDSWLTRRRDTTATGAQFALRQLRDKAPFIALAMTAVVIELFARRGQVEFASLAEHGLAARTSQAGLSMCFFLAKTLWPVGLSPLYEFRPGVSPEGLIAGIAALVLSAALFIARRRVSGAFHAWLACLMLLAPVCGFAQAGLQRYADRHTYLVSMALSLCVGVALAQTLTLAMSRSLRWTALACVLALFTAESVASGRQLRFWRNSESLWRRVVDVDPQSFVGWHNLGTTLHRAGRSLEAIDAERASIRIEPGIRSNRARFHLGHLEWLLGDRERAKQTWSAALKLDPQDLAYLDWLASTQPTAQARRSLWTLALEAAPDNAAISSRLQ